MSLSSASEEMFYQIWEARQKYDIARHSVAAVPGIAAGIGAGLVTSAVITSIAMPALTASAAAASAALSAATVVGVTVLVPIAIGLVSAAIAYRLALELSTAIFDIGLERKVNKIQKKFIAEVDRSTLELTEQIKKSVFDLFDREFKSLEQNFFQFRSSTFIDVNKTLQLKEKFAALEKELALYE
jgi:hypothetical protein